MKHMPGPWHLCGKFDAETSVEVLSNGEFEDCMVAEINPFLEDWTDEEMANVRLIAAAPEILEALQAFTDAAQSWHDFHHGDEFVQCDELCACLPAAKAALAKATERPS